MEKRITVEDDDLYPEWADCGPWRSFSFTATGTDYESLVEDATISEVDQDGGELACYGLDQADSVVYDRVIEAINRRLSKGVKHEASLLGKN
jgi:hypothetical protein